MPRIRTPVAPMVGAAHGRGPPSRAGADYFFLGLGFPPVNWGSMDNILYTKTRHELVLRVRPGVPRARSGIRDRATHRPRQSTPTSARSTRHSAVSTVETARVAGESSHLLVTHTVSEAHVSIIICAAVFSMLSIPSSSIIHHPSTMHPSSDSSSIVTGLRRVSRPHPRLPSGR